MTVTITPYDTADYLKTEEDITAYLKAAIEENDPELLTVALGDIARSQGMSEVARRAGLSRENIYRSLFENGNPSTATLFNVLGALGIQLHPTVSLPEMKTTKSKLRMC
ncbi:MAG: putative addiction module antidote protein [Coriobacteriia bacterium]|nr:putative addiction module antidote protein [Coriobacteriia bacterium]